MIRFVGPMILILVAAGALPANENIAAGTPLGLAIKKKIQDELKLSPEQVKALKLLHQKATKDEKLAALDQLKKELKPEQMKRLKEISLQVLGGSALADQALVKELNLSLTQKRKIGDIWKNEEENLRQILRVTKFKNPAAKRKFILEHRKSAGKKMLEYLTDEQTAAIRKMQGAAIDLKGLDN